MGLMRLKDLDVYESKSIVDHIDRSLTYVSILGEGNSGRVVKVKNGKNFFALKIHRDEFNYLKGDRNPFRDSLIDEFKTQKALEDIRGVPGTIHLYGREAFLMQLVEGKTLDKVQGLGAYFFSEISDIVREISRRGYVHEDIYMRNVIVDSNEKPWIIDFGKFKKVQLPVELRIIESTEGSLDALKRQYEGISWNQTK